jgi:Fe2+ or Zn2+ uptake regulation protein
MPSIKNKQERSTKYIRAVKDIILAMGHASNGEILGELRKVYPDVSSTTVHRVTTRLIERKEIGVAPPSQDLSMRFDSNTKPHDHFMCSKCGMLKDANIQERLREDLERIIGDNCRISGRLMITGVCSRCATTQEK